MAGFEVRGSVVKARAGEPSATRLRGLTPRRSRSVPVACRVSSRRSRAACRLPSSRTLTGQCWSSRAAERSDDHGEPCGAMASAGVPGARRPDAGWPDAGWPDARRRSRIRSRCGRREAWRRCTGRGAVLAVVSESWQLGKGGGSVRAAAAPRRARNHAGRRRSRGRSARGLLGPVSPAWPRTAPGGPRVTQGTEPDPGVPDGHLPLTPESSDQGRATRMQDAARAASPAGAAQARASCVVAAVSRLAASRRARRRRCRMTCATMAAAAAASR